MKRILACIVAVGAFVIGCGALVQAGVNDFRITQFEADYYLGKDKDGRSTLRTVEKITADFPQTDQNHGIERALPKEYDGHSTQLSVESVTDETGVRRPFTTVTSNKNEVLRIGDKDTYAHGKTTYVITYTQRDVTKQFNGKDEFYWDINGT